MAIKYAYPDTQEDKSNQRDAFVTDIFVSCILCMNPANKQIHMRVGDSDRRQKKVNICEHCLHALKNAH